jgi:hypothetical protein
VVTASVTPRCRARPLTGQYWRRRPPAAQAAADDADAFVAQEAFGEVGVGHAHVAQAVEHAAAAEQLGLQPLTASAGLQISSLISNSMA